MSLLLPLSILYYVFYVWDGVDLLYFLVGGIIGVFCWFILKK